MRVGFEHEARECGAFYLRGREASTLVIYNIEYRRLVQFYRKFGKLVCVFEERDV